jgi:broad specificity phosphatase PhoE
MPIKIILVRHGEAEHNVAFHRDGESVFQDPQYADAPLTETGRTQARELGKKLSSYKILDIWSSPLSRCIQTAEEIFEETEAENLYLHDNFLERQGDERPCNLRRFKSEIQSMFPGWDCECLPEVPAYWAEQETNGSLHQRMFMMILHLKFLYRDAAEGSHVIIVSHGDAISTMTKQTLKNAEFIII